MMAEPLRHSWEEAKNPARGRWRCVRCGRQKFHRNVNGPQGLCQGDPFRPSYDALTAEVTAMRAMLAEFA